MSTSRRLIAAISMFVILMFSFAYADAQNIIKAEYFIDADPGFNNGTNIPVTPGTDVTANFQLPVTGLSLGFHNLFIRAYTAPYTVTSGANQGPKGGWSITNSRAIYKDNILLGPGTLPNLIRGEYFYDTDPGIGNATAISFTPAVDVSNVSFTSDITSLSLGFHYMYVRFQDANGHWSLTAERVLYKELYATQQDAASPVVAGEYYFDTDPGIGNGKSIALSQGTDITNIAFTADITQLATGFHNISIRFKNALGQWSLTSTRSVYKEQMQVTNPAAIVKMEQFLDTDPGFGQATNVQFTSGTDVMVNFAVDLTGQPVGNHTLYVRALDANGKWSIVNNADIHICTPATLSASHTDQSNCTANDGTITLTVNGGTSPFTYLWSNGSTNKDISNLAPGNYTVTVTDAQPCPAALTVAILPAAIINLHTDSVNTSCGNQNGSATVSVTSGGTAPFTYSWSNGATTASIGGLTAGVYTVTVTDHNNCTATTQVNIGSSAATPAPEITVTQPNDPCTSTGTTITSSPADSYLWSTGATSQSIVATATGTYGLTVTTNGCSASGSVAVIISSGNKTTLTYSGAPGFTNTLVSPSGSIPMATYRFEAKYTNSAGIMPSQNYPQVLLDVNGNGIVDENDLAFYMIEKDPTDQDVTDGKDYYYVANGLPESPNYTTTIVANDQGGCTGTFGPFAGPRPLTTADVSVFANDISFSNAKPAVNSPITVYATIHNNSGSDADNFVVHLVNQYSPSTVYPDITIPHLSNIAPNNTVQVSWNITTPAVPAWCPMQVYADYTNVLAEANELDNQAIRPFTNGNFQLPGDIAITAGANPATVLTGSLLSVTGNAYYRGTAVQLLNPSCAGATVICTLVETQQTFTGYSDAFGNYSVGVTAPVTPGIYHAKVDITDYTLDGDTSTLFTTIQVPPCTGPDLFGKVILKPGLTYNPNIGYPYPIMNILAGDTVGGTLLVTNIGNAATSGTSTVQLSVAGGSIVPGPYTVPNLQPGDTFTIQLPAIQFASPLSTSIQTTVDSYNTVAECDELNNTSTQSILVLPPLPDIIAYNQVFETVKQCLLHTIGFQLSNGGGVPTGNFNARLIVKLNNVVVDSVNQTVPSIPAQMQGSVSFDFTPSATGLYTCYLQCDIPDTIVEVSETNNNAIAQIQVLQCYPDLAVLGCGSLNVNPVDPKATDTIQISATVYNGGYTATPTPFRVRFLAAGSPYYVTVNDPIPVHGSKTLSVTIPTPAYGNNQLIVKADADSVITEESESNNEATGSLCTDFALTNSPCSDRYIYFISPSQSVGVPVTLATGLLNSGLYQASKAQVKFQVSGPGITGTQTVGVVNTFIANTCGCPLPLSLPGQFVFPQTGLYQVTITVDYNNLYTECNEANNILVIPVTVSVPVYQPDYVMKSEYIAPSLLNPDVDQHITLDVSYLNQGHSDVNNIEIYTQVDNTPFDSVNAPGIAAGKINTVHINNAWSSSLRGVHVIRAIADHQDVVAETDENNNEATRAIIVGKAPNLRFTSLTVSDSTPVVGSTITVSTTITNDGFVGCLTTYQLFYLDNSNAEVLISQRSVTVDSLGNKVVTVPWTVTDPATKLIARISNTSPVEYNLLDNADTIEIGRLVINLSSSAAACPSGKSGIARAKATGGLAPYVKLWSTGETGDSINVNPGTYSVTVSDADGNSISDSVLVTGNGTTPVVTASASNTDICAGSSVTLHGGGASTYTWSDGGGVSGIQDGVAFIPLSTGTYTVTGFNSGGCSSTANVTVIVHPLPVINNVLTTPSSGSDGTITITATGATEYSIDGIIYQASNVFTGLAPGTYMLYARIFGTCSSTQTATVNSSVQSSPTITSFTPDNGYTGTSVTITGTNFTGATAVTIGGTNVASFTVNDDSHITAIVDTGTTGVVSVSTPGGIASSANNFTYKGYLTVNNGNWSDGATWQGGSVPPAGLSVTINHIVTMDVSPTVSNGNSIVVNGTLNCAYNTVSGTGSAIINGIIKTPNGAGFSGASNASFTNSLSSIILGPSSTVEYNGAFSTIISENIYANLASSGAGGRLLPQGRIGISGIFTPGTNNWTTLYASSTVEFNGNGPQNIPAIPYDNLSVSNGGTKTLAAAIVAGRNITIGASTTLDASANNYSISLAGDWLNNGTFAAGTGTVSFNGTASQAIEGSSITAFRDLTINNNSVVGLGQDIEVDGTLHLQSGNISTSANKVIISGTGNINGGGANAHIDGTLQRHVNTGNSSVFLPVGGASTYLPVTLDFSGVTTAGDIISSVSPFGGDHPSIGTSSLDANKSVNRYWTLTNNTIAGGTYDATFVYTPGDIDAGANPANFKMGKYSSGTWSYPTTVDVSATSTKATGLSGFSDFAIAESGCVNPSVSAGNITGSTTACGIAGTTTTASYSIDNIPGATYSWTTSITRIQIVSGQNTNSINATFSSNFSSGTITVTVTNTCGIATRVIAISKKTPAKPGVISGITNPCPYIGSPVTYSIAKVDGAVSYTWTVPAGASIVGHPSPYTSPDTSINVIFLASFTSNTISVTAGNACGTSAARTLTVTSKIPATPGIISGPTDVCDFIGANANVTYTINKVANATSYQWQVPAGVTIISTNINDTTIVLNFPGTYTTGTIQVKAKSGCGDGAFRSLTVAKKLPGTPGVITPTGDICSSMYTGTNTVTYTIPANTTAPLPTSYVWTLVPTVSQSALIVSGSGIVGSTGLTVETTGLIIQIQFYGNYTGGTLSVVAKKSCGTSAARNLTLTKNVPPTPAIPIASGNICSGVASSVTYTVSANPNSDYYIWTSPAGTKINGSQTKSPTKDTTTANSIVVNYPANFVSGNLTVKTTSICGTSKVTTLAVASQACSMLNSVVKNTEIYQNESSAVIYPNPNDGDFMLKIKSPYKTQNVQIEITDILGRYVGRYTASNDNGSILLHVNNKSLTGGTYILKYKIGDEVKFLKFIIQK